MTAGRRARRGRVRRERRIGRIGRKRWERRVGRIPRSSAGLLGSAFAAIVGLAVAAQDVERLPDRVDEPNTVGLRFVFSAPASQTDAQPVQLLAQFIQFSRFRALTLAPLPFLALFELLTQIVEGALEPFEIALKVALRPEVVFAVAPPAPRV
jgi:hypothetical protein